MMNLSQRQERVVATIIVAIQLVTAAVFVPLPPFLRSVHWVVLVETARQWLLGLLRTVGKPASVSSLGALLGALLSYAFWILLPILVILWLLRLRRGLVVSADGRPL